MRRLFVLVITILALSGCMRVVVTAREGSTVIVNQEKTVTTSTDASIPAAAMGM